MTEERYRHKKRGSTYTVIARGFLQVDGDLDNEKVVVYRGEDGRFERLPDAKRETFDVPEGYEAVRDADGMATGEVRKVDPTTTANVDVEDAREQKLAAVVPPDNGTSHEVLLAVLECAKAWVQEARIIGNVRAGDIARAIDELLHGYAAGIDHAAQIADGYDQTDTLTAPKAIASAIRASIAAETPSNGLKHPTYAHGISDGDLIKEAIAFCDEELDGYEGMEYDDDCEVACQRSNTFIRELVRRLELSGGRGGHGSRSAIRGGCDVSTQ